MKKDKVLGCLIGVCVGDSLGLSAEFGSRLTLEKKPITQMNGFGTHNQPPGTWSDDSSLTFCLADYLCSGFNLDDIADKFIKWLFKSYWTSRGDVFDVGGTTYNAIQRLKQGEACFRDEYSNGNGSLMRISPMIFYLENKDVDTQLNLTHQVSCLTHGHIRSQMAYGYADIPQKWVNSIARIDDIKQLCERFYTAITEG